MSNKLPVTIKQDVDILLYNFYPEALTPMQVMRKVNNPITGCYDWHEYSYYLEELNRKGTVRMVGLNADGMSKYVYNERSIT